MWYLGYLLFATIESDSEEEYVCETCNVLFEAVTAEEALQAAELWAKGYETETKKFVGIEEIRYIQDDRPKHGDEIAGSIFNEKDIWSRVLDFIPKKTELAAIRWEGEEANIPIENQLSEKEVNNLKKILDNE